MIHDGTLCGQKLFGVALVIPQPSPVDDHVGLVILWPKGGEGGESVPDPGNRKEELPRLANGERNRCLAVANGR